MKPLPHRLICEILTTSAGRIPVSGWEIVVPTKAGTRVGVNVGVFVGVGVLVTDGVHGMEVY